MRYVCISYGFANFRSFCTSFSDNLVTVALSRFQWHRWVSTLNQTSVSVVSSEAAKREN